MGIVKGKNRIDENRSAERFLVSNYMPPAGIEKQPEILILKTFLYTLVNFWSKFLFSFLFFINHKLSNQFILLINHLLKHMTISIYNLLYIFMPQ